MYQPRTFPQYNRAEVHFGARCSDVRCQVGGWYPTAADAIRWVGDFTRPQCKGDVQKESRLNGSPRARVVPTLFLETQVCAQLHLQRANAIRGSCLAWSFDCLVSHSTDVLTVCLSVSMYDTFDVSES